MIIGCVRELKSQEYRVGLTPANVVDYVAHGHSVLIETDTGAGSYFTDTLYQQAGAAIIPTAAAVWQKADMIVKVKEPLPQEYASIRPDQIIYTYLHLAASRSLTDALLASGCRAVAYETVTDSRGGLPLLRPMSEVAGRLCVQEGAHYLEKTNNGRGVLHYGVANIPGAVPRTSTMALTNATISYGLSIADHGLDEAARLDEGLKNGVNVDRGRCTCQNVAKSFGIEYSPFQA